MKDKVELEFRLGSLQQSGLGGVVYQIQCEHTAHARVQFVLVQKVVPLKPWN